MKSRSGVKVLHTVMTRSPPCALIRAPGQRTNRRISTQRATERRCPMKPWLQRSAVLCRGVGYSAADRIVLTSGQPRATTTTLPAGHVLELRDGCMRIPATSARVHRSVVAGLRPGYHRCRHRPRCRYPNSRPSRYRGSRATRWDRARGTEYRASWTTTPTSRWGWWSAWRWATLGHITEASPNWFPICGAAWC